MKKINLDALLSMQHQVEKNGQSYDVRPVTPRVAYMVEAAASAEGAAKVTQYYDAAAHLVPTMPRHEIDDLTVSQVMAIIELASEQLHVVQEALADPNAQSPSTAAAPTGLGA